MNNDRLNPTNVLLSAILSELKALNNRLTPGFGTAEARRLEAMRAEAIRRMEGYYPDRQRDSWQA